jgi:hypothetical protein
MTELLETRQVNRSAHVVKTAESTSIYLGVCTEHERPVRFEATDPGPAKRQIPCPEGGHLIDGELLQAVTTKLDCDGQCMFAFRNFCGCGCGGANHGKHWGTLLGQSEQLDSALDKWRTARRTVEAKRQQRQQAAERKAKATFDDWAEENRDLVGSLIAHQEHEDANPFLCDLALQVSTGRNGNGPKALSEGQVSAAIRVLRQYEDRVRQLAEREAAAKPCPVGKVEISGLIVKVKVRSGFAYNSDEYKAVVACDGYAVWVTLPKSLLAFAADQRLFWKLRETVEFTEPDRYSRGTDYYAMSENCTRVFKGFRLSFTAEVERSEKDESFGFGKRPSRVTFTAPAN